MTPLGTRVHYVQFIGTRVCREVVLVGWTNRGTALLSDDGEHEWFEAERGWDAPYRGSWHPAGRVCEGRDEE